MLENFLKTSKEKIHDWGDDILAGFSFSGLASLLKYVTQHFIDVGWTVTAAVFVMLATHFTKKVIVPKLDRVYKKWFK